MYPGLIVLIAAMYSVGLLPGFLEYAYPNSTITRTQLARRRLIAILWPLALPIVGMYYLYRGARALPAIVHQFTCDLIGVTRKEIRVEKDNYQIEAEREVDSYLLQLKG